MLKDKIKKLKELSDRLSPIQAQQFETVLDKLILKLNAQIESTDRLPRTNRKSHTTPNEAAELANLFKLKEFVLKKRKSPLEIDNILYCHVWHLIPEISSFKDVNELDNFLSYTLHSNIKKPASYAQSKDKLVEWYRNAFDAMDQDAKQTVFNDLARRIFATATKEDFSRIVKKDKHCESAILKEKA